MIPKLDTYMVRLHEPVLTPDEKTALDNAINMFSKNTFERASEHLVLVPMQTRFQDNPVAIARLEKFTSAILSDAFNANDVRLTQKNPPLPPPSIEKQATLSPAPAPTSPNSTPRDFKEYLVTTIRKIVKAYDDKNIVLGLQTINEIITDFQNPGEARFMALFKENLRNIARLEPENLNQKKVTEILLSTKKEAATPVASATTTPTPTTFQNSPKPIPEPKIIDVIPTLPVKSNDVFFIPNEKWEDRFDPRDWEQDPVAEETSEVEEKKTKKPQSGKKIDKSEFKLKRMAKRDPLKAPEQRALIAKFKETFEAGRKGEAMQMLYTAPQTATLKKLIKEYVPKLPDNFAPKPSKPVINLATPPLPEHDASKAIPIAVSEAKDDESTEHLERKRPAEERLEVESKVARVELEPEPGSDE